MADHDKDLHRVSALNAWRWKLLNEPEQARKDAIAVLDAAATPCFPQTDRTRYFSQMMNGCAVPSDFGLGHIA